MYRLGDIGKTLSGVGFPDREQGGESGTPFYKVSDMNNKGNEQIMQSANNYVSNEQIARMGWHVCTAPSIFFAKVGAAVLLNRKRLTLQPCLCDNNTMLYRFDEKKWDAYFCLTLFNTLDLAPLAQTGSLPSYNGTMVEAITVKLPPTMEEQKFIARHFHSLDTKISLQTQRIEKLKQMKAACLNRMIA